MITNADIDIFLLTCERTNYLNDAIKSLLLQTCGVDRIFIVDNSHSDNVENLVLSIDDKRLVYYRTSSLGRHGNYKKILELCTREYLAIFHDDDIIHPKYIESFLNYKNKFASTDVKIYGCAQKSIDSATTVENIEFLPINNQFFVTENCSLFLSLLYADFFDCVTPSLIYKREIFLKSNNIELYKTYGKLSDSAKLMSVASDIDGGEIVVLLSQSYFYRKYCNQDSQVKGGLSIEQFNNFVRSLLKFTKNFKYCDYFQVISILMSFYQYVFTETKFEVWLRNFMKEYRQKGVAMCIWEIMLKRHDSKKDYFKYILLKYQYKIYILLHKYIERLILKAYTRSF